ncbi:MAG: hypothetical protein AABY13_04975, partial [Nanoarchaeota archaeon]
MNARRGYISVEKLVRRFETAYDSARASKRAAPEHYAQLLAFYQAIKAHPDADKLLIQLTYARTIEVYNLARRTNPLISSLSSVRTTTRQWTDSFLDNARRSLRQRTNAPQPARAPQPAQTTTTKPLTVQKTRPSIAATSRPARPVRQPALRPAPTTREWIESVLSGQLPTETTPVRQPSTTTGPQQPTVLRQALPAQTPPTPIPVSIREPSPWRKPAGDGHASHAFIMVFVVAVIIGSLLYAGSSNLTGLFSVDATVQSLSVGTTYTATIRQTFQLSGTPTGIEISGTLDAGNASVWLVQPSGSSLLVWEGSGPATFDHVCDSVCNGLRLTSSAVTLDIEPHGGSFTLGAIQYIRVEDNRAPLFIASTSTIQVPGQLTLDLSAMFDDPDGDSLSFIATSAPGVDVQVFGDQLTITLLGDISGTPQITVIASDAVTATSQPLTIEPATLLPQGMIKAPTGTRAPATEPEPTPEPTPTPEPEPIAEPTPAPTDPVEPAPTPT